ncbi:EF-hand calcium-binding domain-containing protein 4A-like [Polyodon spathula]|uniref:EF-hand calcium-binding domain-containing protein 4A-like n=1 Tax=Polyodon spathula TaxID=7913 RepID=UPI001B7E15E4|nr:EF-hand calcium-binding domain-containing protein 4A-like [Polyodon spathula]XP_041074557.1 EF-hand calcium-binding domain-containing protein 4A-like [Polyodon spathula]
MAGRRRGIELLGEGADSPRAGRRGQQAAGSPRAGRGEAAAGSVQQEMLEKARVLFQLCDKEEKGFITKRDMQRLENELPLTPEQLEDVFDSLDQDGNGYLTPLEFSMGLGRYIGVEVLPEPEGSDSSVLEDTFVSGGWEEDLSMLEDSEERRFCVMMQQLGATQVFKDQSEVRELWARLHRDRPELLSDFEKLLSKVSTHIQEVHLEKNSMEQALHRRECDHDREVHSLYKEMEHQITIEKDRLLNQDSLRQSDKSLQLQRELGTKEQELEGIVGRQRQLESQLHELSYEQMETRVQNERLRHTNKDLQDQLERSRRELDTAQHHLRQLQEEASREQRQKDRDIVKVSRNMQKEKESLLKQLELLREMNKKLHDERDAHESRKLKPSGKKPLLKKGSVIGKYFMEEKPIKRQLSPPNLASPTPEEVTSEPNRKNSKYVTNQGAEEADGCVEEAGQRQEEEEIKLLARGLPVGTETVDCSSSSLPPERVFKVVLVGNSGVGKSSFIYRFCQGCFLSEIRATVGIDYQVRSLSVDSTPVALQLWDTAGQERFRSITKQYFRKADGILVMYDVTQESSFTAVRNWMISVQEGVEDSAVIFLLGNKTDMAGPERREVTTEEGLRLAEEYQAVFYECSAKAEYNITQPMMHMARLLAEQEDKQCYSALYLSKDYNKKKGCCIKN